MLEVDVWSLCGVGWNGMGVEWNGMEWGRGGVVRCMYYNIINI